MNKKYLIICLVLIGNMAMASVPTVEGLFRNSSNKVVTAEAVIVSYSIEEQQNELLMQKTESEVVNNGLETEMLKEKTKPIFVKETLYKDSDSNTVQSIKYLYNSGEMKKRDMVKFKYSPNYRSKIINEFNVNKRLLSSLAMMYLRNNSEVIGTLLKEKGNNYLSNKQILNSDKTKLLENYKEYLISTKEDPDLREELSSPLNPTDLEEKGKVLDLMKKNIYQKTNQVKLVKTQNGFRWNVDLGTINAEFSNEGHRLKKFNLQSNGNIEVTTGDHVLFNGIHELPKVIIFKSSNDRVYKIRFLSLKHYQSYKKSFSKAIKNLSKSEKEVRESGELYSEHPLIL
jgi:hypothetical protein